MTTVDIHGWPWLLNKDKSEWKSVTSVLYNLLCFKCAFQSVVFQMCFSKLNSPFSCEVALPPPGENWLLTITRSLIATFHRRIRSGTFLFLKTRWRCETWKWKLWCNKIYLNWIWQKFNLVFFGDLSSKIWSLLTKCQRGISESFQNWRTYLGLLYEIKIVKKFNPHTIVKNLLEPSNNKILEKISVSISNLSSFQTENVQCASASSQNPNW